MPHMRTESLGQRLRRERMRLNWSQERLAEAIGTTSMSINRWEHDKTSPQPHYREQLCHVFHTTADALFGTPDESESQTHPVDSIWNVPFRRNPFFTGREAVLRRLYDTLRSGRTAVLTQAQALSGLGGIGKTQTAVEYAYRHREDYRAVLWVRAETLEGLLTDLVSLAQVVGLPEKDEPDQNRIVQAVKCWLNEYPNWLLILDNVEDLSVLEDVLPSQARGHLLLTTRAQSTGIFAQSIDLDQMELEEGALFLLHRAKLLGPDAPLEQAPQGLAPIAKELTQIMGGLPLALDQAGAYIEETECSLSDYRERYQTRQASLLNRRGNLVGAHPASVSTTFFLSFEKVERANPAAAELLRVCAFLAPDAIPEEILTEGASELGAALESVAADPLVLDETLAALRTYSLLRRHAESKTLTIHRLVQAVLKDRMDEKTQLQWAERTVYAVNQVFPDGAAAATWPRCQRLLPHVEACVHLMKQWKIVSRDAWRLLKEAGTYLRERGNYMQAEVLLCQARDIRVQVVGTMHPDVAESLNNLALLYWNQGRYTEAEPLHLRAMTIQEQHLGPDHPDLAESLNDLAALYWNQGRYTEAEPLHLRAMTIQEQHLGPDHPDLTESLNGLAMLYWNQGRYTEAEPLLLRSLAIREQHLGPEHLRTSESLNNLALLYWKQGRYTEAEPLYQRALTICEQQLGPEHHGVASCLNNLAQLYLVEGRYTEADPLFQRSLAICEQQLGPEHPSTAQILNNLARLYTEQAKYTEAELLLQRALAIREQQLGPQHPDMAQSLNNLAKLYRDQGQYDQAEPIFRQVLDMRERGLGSEHPDVATTLENYAELLRKTNRTVEATEREERAQQIRERHAQQNPLR